VNDGKSHGIGPDLAGVLGKRIAGYDGYAYSQALSSVDGVWTEETLDAFLADPQAFAPGNIMTSGQLTDPSERAAIIKYLRSF
jgi:cytochrome c